MLMNGKFIRTGMTIFSILFSSTALWGGGNQGGGGSSCSPQYTRVCTITTYYTNGNVDTSTPSQNIETNLTDEACLNSYCQNDTQITARRGGCNNNEIQRSGRPIISAIGTDNGHSYINYAVSPNTDCISCHPGGCYPCVPNCKCQCRSVCISCC